MINRVVHPQRELGDILVSNDLLPAPAPYIPCVSLEFALRWQPSSLEE